MGNQAVWIIGAGKGNGQGIAEAFGKRGYKPVLIARDHNKLLNVQQSLLSEDIASTCVIADSGNLDELRVTLEGLIESEGAPEVLVYNAAAIYPGLPTELTEERLRAEFNVNVLGAFTAVQTVLPKLKERGAGSILFTGGGLGLYPQASLASLSMGKAAIRNLAFSLNEELAAYGIFVGTVTICGFVQEDTPFNSRFVGEAFYQLYEEKSGVEVQLKP
ncbi:SDR family oxidoreductase [Paenibacillus sp. N1-5-1-14]|uniref:SDR family NAD(P)-dependent oxidoreductase n=1 Tax=Paenibacillus radicibacter TaxID=2972488 RepID=UPI0021598D7E|nr:SDR family oxidoreductase [Paenibacillus radicibacter]MCR8644246.1 SDR family oxidoreductase [Paenibacillus radicibacter]